MASYVGTAAVAIWAAATAALAAIAGAKGQAHRVSLLPDWADLGSSDLSRLIEICAVIPILATAFTYQAGVCCSGAWLCSWKLTPACIEQQTWQYQLCTFSWGADVHQLHPEGDAPPHLQAHGHSLGERAMHGLAWTLPLRLRLSCRR